MMGPLKAIGTCTGKIFDFSGRASRSEFWWFSGLVLLSTTVILIWDAENPNIENGFQQPRPVWLAVVLAMALCAAAGSRRYHDQGWNGLWFAIPVLISAIVVIAIEFRYLDFNFGETTGNSRSGISWRGIQSTGLLVFALFSLPIIWFVMLFAALAPSQPGPNKYGPNPHEVPS